MEQSKIAPHVCPQCGSPCYMGAFDLECTGPKCDHYHAETAAAYKAERFPSASTLLENEDTQPGVSRWPSVPPSAIFPDTDAELVQQVKDGVAEAKKNATPAEAKALDDWLKEILEQYVTAWGENWIPVHIEAERNISDPTRLDVTIQLTQIVPVEVPRTKIFLDDDQQGKLDAAIHAYTQRAGEWWADAYGAGSIVAAKGEQLDRWAELIGGEPDLIVVRAPGETDEEMRERLAKRWGQFGPGASL